MGLLLGNGALEASKVLYCLGLDVLPGTGDRYIAEDDASPGMIEIQLRWKQGDMPDETAREKALEAFREMFADVLDWEMARYGMKTVLLHT